MQIEARDILFVINPNSGKQNPDSIIKQIKDSGHDIDYTLTQSLEDFNSLWDKKVDDYKVVVICGGDGSVNCTLKHLVVKKILFLPYCLMVQVMVLLVSLVLPVMLGILLKRC